MDILMASISIFKEPARRGAGKVPWGFRLNPDNPAEVLPDLHLLTVLEQGLNHRLAGHSAREVAAWITSKTGKAIDHRGLDRRIVKERKLARQRQRNLPKLLQAGPVL